ncbi:putative phosphoglycerate mutase [Arthrobacter pigmenti]|uniref:Putative phosphoglycerate mutase n=1 Tax=Arthrobacter pigmenti TaxID=271432 RepID=A0A846RLJ9_9MICC|nr:putative phosphoglycerate mutase [Arthrobacter pigmenti]
MQETEIPLFDDVPTEPHQEARSGFLIVEADGGSRGNPGHAGYGALVRDPESGRILVEKAGYVGIASNNVAEYSGLIAGLELAHEVDPNCRILVKMDSKLVVEQMSGRWKIKHSDMQNLASKARRAVEPRRVRYEWIPRERNKDADRLSNEAMDAGISGVEWTPRKPVQKTVEAAVVVPQPEPDVPPQPSGSLHHIEIWVRNIDSAKESFGWLFERLGFVPRDSWNDGASWAGRGAYLVLEAGPDVLPEPHERRRAGINHLAFNAGSRAEVDLLARRATSHGWSLLFAEKHPHAGGPDHYAAYLENADGFEVELVAEP